VTLAADFGTGEVLWSFLWFFLFFIFILLIFQIFGDIIRSDDLSGWGKALWSLFIIFLPFLGIFVYVIARGGKMHERQVRSMQKNEQAMQQYIRDTARETGIERHIRYRTRAVDASWSSDRARWSVRTLVGEDPTPRTLTCSFLYVCTGLTSPFTTLDINARSWRSNCQ